MQHLKPVGVQEDGVDSVLIEAPTTKSKGKGKAKEKLGKMGPPVDKAWLEKWRIKLKIAAVSIIASALFPCDR